MVDIPEDLSFEDAFAQLEEVLAAMEDGELTLDESMAKYELGVALSAFCQAKLESAELRVRQWQADDTTAEFDEWQDD